MDLGGYFGCATRGERVRGEGDGQNYDVVWRNTEWLREGLHRAGGEGIFWIEFDDFMR